MCFSFSNGKYGDTFSLHRSRFRVSMNSSQELTFVAFFEGQRKCASRAASGIIHIDLTKAVPFAV